MLGIRPIDWIRRYGLGKALFNWESGRDFADVGFLIRLCEDYPPLTLEWFYRGANSPLQTDVPAALVRAQAEAGSRPAASENATDPAQDRILADDTA